MTEDREYPPYFRDEDKNDDFFEPLDPYKDPPKCPVNLLELSRYLRKTGKKMSDLTQEEYDQFRIEKSSGTKPE